MFSKKHENHKFKSLDPSPTLLIFLSSKNEIKIEFLLFDDQDAFIEARLAAAQTKSSGQHEFDKSYFLFPWKRKIAARAIPSAIMTA